MADDLVWVTGQLYGIIIVCGHWDFMLNMRMRGWATTFDFNCCSLSYCKHENTGENERMTSSMGDDNGAAQGTLVTDAALSEGLVQRYNAQRSEAAQRGLRIK